MKSDEAFRWIEARTCRYTALGVVMVWNGGLRSGDLRWERDARDLAAALGLAGYGKWHRRDLADDLLREPDAPVALRALSSVLDGKLGRTGRPPMAPLHALRNKGVAIAARSLHAKGETFDVIDEALAREVDLRPNHVRAIREQGMAQDAPRLRGRKRRREK